MRHPRPRSTMPRQREDAPAQPAGSGKSGSLKRWTANSSFVVRALACLRCTHHVAREPAECDAASAAALGFTPHRDRRVSLYSASSAKGGAPLPHSKFNPPCALAGGRHLDKARIKPLQPRPDRTARPSRNGCRPCTPSALRRVRRKSGERAAPEQAVDLLPIKTLKRLLSDSSPSRAMRGGAQRLWSPTPNDDESGDAMEPG